MDEQKDTSVTFKTVGKILLAIGIIYMCFGLFPYLYYSYQSSYSEGKMNSGKEELKSLKPMKRQLWETRMWFPVSQRGDNPRWLKYLENKKQYEQDEKAAKKIIYKARKHMRAAKHNLAKYNYERHAVISTVIFLLGLLAFFLPLKPKV